jgi:hypothetical protein
VSGIVVGLIVGIALMLIQERRNNRRGLVVLQARYGKDGRSKDITDPLNAAIVDNRLEMTLSNDIAGDPAPGTPKIGNIKYRYKGRIYEKEYVETEVVKLP